MTTSGVYSFNPSIGEVTLYAYNRLGIRPPALTQDHMFDARMAANMVLLHWSNKQVNLWKVDLVTQTLVPGTSTYNVDPSVVLILDMYITVTTGSTAIDRYIQPVSRTEYASYSDKTMEGFPTVYWHDRLIAPTVTIWPVPPTNSTYTMNYYVVRQIQDANLTSAQTADIVPLWIPAFAYGLAEELAISWAPDKLPMIAGRAKEFYDAAASTNVEQSQIFISPTLAGYWRT